MNMAQRVTPSFSNNETRDPTDVKWLTGNEVVQITGISKSDLIRFIQLGVLPKSMLRVSTVGHEDSRKKSYFSSSAIGHVTLLKRLRDDGRSVDEIATDMQDVLKAVSTPRAQLLPTTRPNAPTPEKEPEKKTAPQVHLPVDTITDSAFFVDHDLRIEWIKVKQGDHLSRAIQNELTDDPSGTVFDIMLRASLKELVFNWQPLFSFTYRFLQATTPPETFNRLAPTISLNRGKMNQSEASNPGEVKPCPIDSCPIHLEDKHGHTQAMRIYGMALSEGTLFVLDEDRWRNVLTGGSATGETDTAAKTDGETANGKTPFSVLSARLDDSRSIVDTLLPETYFQLMTRIWDESDRVLGSYGGHRAKRSGTEVQYIIPRHADTDPAYDAIRCAVELRDKMCAIEASLKTEGGWFSDIRLNIGISSGRDHLQPEDPTASMAFMLPGGAADQAFHLSAIAHGGAIWITKSAFSHLSPQQMNRITFGIYRDDRLVHNIFAQVSDLPHAPDTPPLGRGIRSLSVTRIIDLQPDRQ